MTLYSLPQNKDQNYLLIGQFSFDGRYGLPNSVREALLGLKHGDTALLLDALFSTGYKCGQLFMFDEIVAHLARFDIRPTPELIRRALAVPSIFRRGKKMSHKKGRPAAVYHMPGMQELVDQFANGFWSASDPIQTSALSGLKEYRQALYLGLLQRLPGIYSRFFLSQRLGITRRTTRSYDKALGVVVEARLMVQSITKNMNWQGWLKYAKVGLNWLQIRFRDGRVMNAPLKEGIVWKYLFRWHEVEGIYMVTQLSNRYSVAA